MVSFMLRPLTLRNNFLVIMYYPGIHLGLRKTTENLGQDIRFADEVK
jgi:hypothetical protein